jgi:hypothetical protein
MQGTMEQGDRAIFSIYDNLTQTVVLEKEMIPDGNTLSYNFASEDTLGIEPDDRGSRYSWDVTIQRNPLYDENEQLVRYDSIDSYYAAFSLPPCIIKRVTRHV